MKRIKDQFQGLSIQARAVALCMIILTILSAGGASALAHLNDALTSTSVNQSKQVQTVTPARAPKVEKKVVTTTEPVKFTSSTVDDPNLASGTTQTRTVGVDGVKTHYFEVTYTDEIETNRTETKNEVTTEPVNEVIARGTKVSKPAPVAAEPSCPNGTYVNAYGNTVCRPYESSTVPSGASAQCVDGTYSFSQSRRGTCSHHGGVATWY